MANLFKPLKQLQKEPSNVSTTSTASNSTVSSTSTTLSKRSANNDDFISLIDPPRKELDAELLFTKRDDFINNCRKQKSDQTDVGPQVVTAICKCLANPNATVCHIAQDLLMADLFRFKDYQKGLTEILARLALLPEMIREFTDFNGKLKPSLDEYIAFCNLLQFKTRDDADVFAINKSWNKSFDIVTDVFSNYHPYYAAISKSLIEVCPWKTLDTSQKYLLLEKIRRFLDDYTDPQWRTLQEQMWFNQVFCQIWRKILSSIELAEPHESCLRMLGEIYSSCADVTMNLPGCTIFTQTMLEIEIFYLTKTESAATARYFEDSLPKAIQIASATFKHEKKNTQPHDASRNVVKQHSIALINKLLHINPQIFRNVLDETVNLYLVNLDSDTLGGWQNAYQEEEKDVLNSVEKRISDFVKILKKETTSEHDLLIILFFFRELAIKGADLHTYTPVFESFLGRKNVSQLAAYVLEIANTHQPTMLVGKGNNWYSQVRHGDDAESSQYFVAHLFKNVGLYSEEEAERTIGLMAIDGKQNVEDDEYINQLMSVWLDIGQSHPKSLRKQKSLITEWRKKHQFSSNAQLLLDLMEKETDVTHKNPSIAKPIQLAAPISDTTNRGNPTVNMVVCSDYLVEMKLLQKNLQQAGYNCNLQRLDVQTYKMLPDTDTHATLIGVTKSICKLPSAKRQLTDIEKINFLIPLILDKTQWPTESSLKPIFVRNTPIDCLHADMLRWDGDEFDELLDRLEQICPQFHPSRKLRPVRPKGILMRSNSVSRRPKKVDFNDVLLYKEISSLSQQEMRPTSVALEDVQFSAYQPVAEESGELEENLSDDYIEGQRGANSRLPKIDTRATTTDNLSKSYANGQSDYRRSGTNNNTNNKANRENNNNNGQRKYKKPPKADYEMPKLPSLYRQNLRRN